ncbi:MAG: haloacid dehalogenase-like hydrolase [Thiotrichaceae bacterium]|nr:haloacid dehalogenase-like hydrolase [Thiotrichaceae bacterium]
MNRLITFFLFFTLIPFVFAHDNDPLPSWNEGENKHHIIQFVQSVSDPKSSDYVAPEDRIATFDNDGTLWSEKPFYFQLYFVIDRIKMLAPQHPEWKTTQPFKAVLENDQETLLKSGKEGLLKLVMATHTGMTDEEFDTIVIEWINSAQHPRFKRPFKELVYQPMLELLSYLRANQFKTFIVSGGGIDFMRPWASEVYGIPSEQIVGSSIVVKYQEGKIIRQPKLNFNDDKEGKPVAIHYHIGKRPIAAFGNSDGDLAMMQYTDASKNKTFKMYIHHTDSKREWAYDRQSHVGALDKGLDYAQEHDWTIIDMKNDWKVVFPFELNGKILK